jgi:hypothetical protein
MKKIILFAVIQIFVLTACATMMGRWSVSKLDKMSDQCIAENEGLKPTITKKFHNLSTQDRTKKKKEFEDYRKKRIELYQSLDSFKTIYIAHTEKDGTCRKDECKPLEKLRMLIISGCPVTGEYFPACNPDQQ